jgi:hypothetical protein
MDVMIIRYRIRNKDKDPSFSAKQARVNDERVWAELGISVLWHTGVIQAH